VINIPGYSAQEVFISTSKWYEKANHGNKLKVKDPALDKSIGKASIRLKEEFANIKRLISFKVDFSVRDEKLKYTLSDFVMDFENGTMHKIEKFSKKNPALKKDIDDCVQEYIAQMKSEIMKNAKAQAY